MVIYGREYLRLWFCRNRKPHNSDRFPLSTWKLHLINSVYFYISLITSSFWKPRFFDFDMSEGFLHGNPCPFFRRFGAMVEVRPINSYAKCNKSCWYLLKSWKIRYKTEYLYNSYSSNMKIPTSCSLLTQISPSQSRAIPLTSIFFILVNSLLYFRSYFFIKNKFLLRSIL